MDPIDLDELKGVFGGNRFGEAGFSGAPEDGDAVAEGAIVRYGDESS